MITADGSGRWTSPLRPAIPATFLAVWAYLALAMHGCGPAAAHCAANACPAGYSCEAATGECRLATSAEARAVPLLGPITALPWASGAPLVVGFAADRQSLVAAGTSGLSYLAGPAANAAESPAGQQSTAVRKQDGSAAVAWIRGSDDTLWLAEQHASSWDRQLVAHKARGPIAAARDGQAVAIAYRRTDAGALRLATLEAPGIWHLEDVPMPNPPANSLKATSDLGRSIGMISGPSGIAISAYDATHRDLILAVRSGGQWFVSRLAGSDPATGADTGDVGDPSALALGPDGGVVVAYRNQSTSQVILSRSAGGQMTREIVADGSAVGPQGTQSQDLIGTAIGLTIRADGRAAVVWFNGTRWRVEYAIQKLNGTFAQFALPTPELARLQAWPAATLNDDGTVWLSWVSLDPAHGPSASRIGQLQLATGAP